MEFGFLIRGLFAVGKMSHERVVPIMGWWSQALYGWIRGNHRGGGMYSGFIDVVAAVDGVIAGYQSAQPAWGGASSGCGDG